MDNKNSAKVELKIIGYKGYMFAIQSYLKDDFVNLSILNGDSFKVDFVSNSITTTGKETKEWQRIKYEFVISEIKILVDWYFYFHYCQSQIEGNKKCKNQCKICKEYFKLLEKDYKKGFELSQIHLRS